MPGRSARSLCLVLASASLLTAAGASLRVTKPETRWSFGGFGFQHSEASLTALMTDEFRDERVLKTFAEISPSFGRVYIGFADMSQAAMDRFADYYDATFRKAGTDLYAVPCAMVPEFPEKADPDAYAEKVATGLDYLVKARKCDRIRFYCLTNELVVNGKWNWFERSGNLPLYRTYNAALHRAFHRHGLDITLLGTDVAVTLKPYDALASLNWAAENMDDILGVYCSHWYVYARRTEDLGLWDKYQPYFSNLVAVATSKRKRFILGEWGFHPAWGKRGVMIDDVKPYWRCPSNRTETVLAKLEVGLAAMNRGSYACVDWSFVDYPDPWIFEDGDTPEEHAAYESAKCVWTPDLKYNKCGLFSWGTVDREYGSCEELYAMGHLARLFRRGSSVLPVETDEPMLRAGAVVNADGSVSLAVINRREAREVTVSSEAKLDKPLRRYVYEADRVPWNDFNDLQPSETPVVAADNRFVVTVPRRSMTFFTTDYADRVPKAVGGVVVKDGRVSWTATDDPHHRYYRVYCNGRQIASTVATQAKAPQPGVYTVRSVDRWGNSGE